MRRLARYRCLIFLVLSISAYVGTFQSVNWYAFIALLLAVWTLP